MSLYESSVPQLAKMLRQLDRWLDKGAAYAKQKNFDVANLLTARLAPDMYPLTRQVQAACDAAKFAAARLGDLEPPKNPDTEQTLEELKARIASTLAFLETVQPKHFEGAAARNVSMNWMPGKALVGDRYLCELALPNFYFHVTTAYAILRHNGVDVGKTDFIGDLPFKDA
jgi:hypothetical protein